MKKPEPEQIRIVIDIPRGALSYYNRTDTRFSVISDQIPTLKQKDRFILEIIELFGATEQNNWINIKDSLYALSKTHKISKIREEISDASTSRITIIKCVKLIKTQATSLPRFDTKEFAYLGKLNIAEAKAFPLTEEEQLVIAKMRGLPDLNGSWVDQLDLSIQSKGDLTNPKSKLTIAGYGIPRLFNVRTVQRGHSASQAWDGTSSQLVKFTIDLNKRTIKVVGEVKIINTDEIIAYVETVLATQ